jgi:uncharacterized protein YndB with AHSA1/START domain
MSDVPDRIEKKVLLRAPRARVWHAISDSQAFGTWFGVAFEGPFVAGQWLRGKIVPTTVDEKVAEQQKPYVGMRCDVLVERIEPEKRLSFRWHPGADPDIDPATAPTTLVSFDLEEAEGGTALTITESGFHQIPLAKRAKAFSDNEGGWAAQCDLLAKYLARGA